VRMRVVLTCLGLAVLAILSVLGFRGTVSRRPPIELFSDMVRQPRLRPQDQFGFFPDGRASRVPVEGTVARGAADPNAPAITGRYRGTTNYLEVNPVPVTRELLEQGRKRFEINCAPCHGLQGDGRGISTRLGLTAIANLHDPRIVRMCDGEIFNTIGRGKGLMQGYAGAISPGDRWAVVAFLRALQLSHLGLLEDVPQERRSEFSE